MDLMAARRGILLDAPQIKTATGTDVTFFADRPADIQSCVLDLSAHQTGSGTPSKANPREIITHKDFTVYHSGADQQTPQAYNYSWSNSRSGGYLNLTTGLLYTTGSAILLSGLENWNAVGSKFYYNLRDTGFLNSSSVAAQLCNMYPFGGIIISGSAAVTQDKHFYLQRTSSTLDYCRIWVYDTDFDLTQFKAFLDQNNLQVTYPIDPFYAQLAPVTIRVNIGQNRIWDTQGGELTVKYWTH